MSNDKKLTIAIPTFDREVFLREALNSINQQIFKEFKVILFDNASPYDIDALAREFPSLAITIDKNATNIGNQGNFAKVMGYSFDTPYVMIFHDDDTIHPQYLAKAVDLLETDSDLMWVGSLIRYTTDGNKMSIFDRAPTTPTLLKCDQKEMVAAFMRNVPIGFSSVVYRREALAEATPDATRFFKWLDRPFMLSAGGNQKMAVLMYPYINYRLHPSQDSAQPYREQIPHMINLIEYFVEIKGYDREALVFGTASAIKTATVNASSIKDFFLILQIFKDRGLYSIKYLRPYSLMWLGWLLWKRVRYSLLKR